MHVILTLSELINISILSALIVVILALHSISSIGYAFSRFIRWIQERIWKK